MASNIAQTRTRLKSYVTLKVIPGGFFWDPTGDDPKVLIDQASKLITVGAAQSLTINQTRETNDVRREFANNRWGVGDSVKPVESYPGIISYTVELARVDLYDKNLFQAFGIDGYNIVDQYKPLILFVEQPVPDMKIGNPAQALNPITRIVTGCWVDKFPIEYDVTATDQKYVVELEMIAQDVITFKPS
jgi:hypothetical protein